MICKPAVNIYKNLCIDVIVNKQIFFRNVHKYTYKTVNISILYTLTMSLAAEVAASSGK